MTSRSRTGCPPRCCSSARSIRYEPSRLRWLAPETRLAAAGAGLDGLALELGLDLGHAVLHLLDLLQHLHRILHSETSFTRVTRPSNRRTTSRTKGSSSGLAGPFPAGLDDSAAASRSR